MSKFNRTMFACATLATLVLAGCGGGGATSSGSGQQLGQGIAVGEPNGGQAVTSEFIKVAQSAICADTRNRLFLIDGKQVFWDRAGNCPDNSYAMVLYGPSPEAVLCSSSDSIAGPVTTCANAANRELFDIIVKNRDAADLGLGASGRKVEQIKFEPAGGTRLAYHTIYHNQMSGVHERSTVVIKDQAAWEKLWAAIYEGNAALPAPPAVDFTSKMVIGVFDGFAPDPCGISAIRGVVSKDGKLVVEQEQAAAPAGIACVAVVVHPAHVIVVDRSDAPVEFVVVKTTAMLMTSLDQTKRSGIQAARNVVIRDKDALASLWAEHAGKDAKLPEVDFTRDMVVGVFAGPGDGCSSTRIASVSRNDKQVTVRHVDTVPGPAVLCTKDLTTPGHVVTVEKSALPVSFVRELQQIH